MDAPGGHYTSRRSPSQKDKCCLTPLTGGMENSQLIETDRKTLIEVEGLVGEGTGSFVQQIQSFSGTG